MEESGLRGGSWLLMEEDDRHVKVDCCLVWNMLRLCDGRVELIIIMLKTDRQQRNENFIVMCCLVLVLPQG